MKITRLIVAVSLVAVLLAGCGDETDESATSTSAATSISDESTSSSTASSTVSLTSTTASSDQSTNSDQSTTSVQSTTAGQSTTTGEVTTIAEFGLSLRLPPGWVQDPDYGEWAFFGDDGFLVLTVMSAPDGVDAVARNEADHVLQPYGADPTIEPYSVDGRDARLIVPLDDSPAVVEGYRQSAVIAAMTAPDSYLALFGDPANLDGIASTLRWQS